MTSEVTGRRQPAEMDFKSCFFCGNSIVGKTSREHIFGDKFLEYLELKQANVRSALRHPTTYSRIKVPAHPKCNNEKGSAFENQLLHLIRSMDRNLDHLSKLHMPTDGDLNQALRETFLLWCAKLYYGLLYWEAGLQKHQKPTYQRYLQVLLSGEEFAYLRRCFVEDLAFRVPSSLFHFHLPDPVHPAMRFDFGDGLPLGLIYVRFRCHLLVGALGDANLVRQWFTEKQVASLQSHIWASREKDPLAYLHAVAHIWAVRELLPVQPRIEYGTAEIRDRSRLNYALAPALDAEAVNERAAQLYTEHAAKWRERGSSPDT